MQIGLGLSLTLPRSAGGASALRMSVVATHQAPPNGTNTGNQDIMSREQLVNVVGAMTTPGQNYYQRTQWIKTYGSKVIMQLGVNDIYNAGRSAAQIAADIATFKTQVNGLPVIPCTIGPNTTSTDSWATLVNQTVKAQEGVRLTYNTATRALGAQNFIDVARFIDPTDTAKWPVNGVANKYTSDGLHETVDGYALEQTNGTPQLTWVV